MSSSPDPFAFLAGPPEQLAPELLGAVLRHGPVAVRLTEVEAYGGSHDPGSHAYRGPTRRNASMYADAGTLYCYLSHGIHVCANVVVGPVGEPGALLLRAGRVVTGSDAVEQRRPGVVEGSWARGPGNLGRSLGLGLEHDGTDLRTGPVRLELPSTSSVAAHPVTWTSGPRVGLRSASDRPWRFMTVDDPSVSAYRRHPKADGRDR
ncbi:MAG: 3-methyladenine DNA glycosylase [Nocardioides sp.]|nr:3-methyladenine DNA glycosylase [Nocardioides sp.]